LSGMKLNLSSTIGEPTNPKTWSGTPFNIYSELKKRNRFGEGFNIEPAGLKKLLLLPYIPFYGMKYKRRALIWRYICSNDVVKKTNQSVSKHTLHMGTDALPFFKKPKDQFHYIYCDVTWNLYSQYATDIPAELKKNLKRIDTIEKRAYEEVEHIFAIGAYVKENLIHHYSIKPEKITVVGTGLGVIKPFTGEKDYSNKKILFTAKGRFKDKGGELVVKAFEKALEADPELQLTIVGCEDGHQYKEMTNVTTMGFIPLAELQKLFETHSLFFMPAFYEPWGLVYLEAMSCKMPVMGLNRNSFPEISGYGKYGFVIDDSDPVAAAKAMVDAFREPEKLKIMGETAQKYCLEEFTWEKVIDRIVKVQEERS
jgi:glycosyltransferase involved in cell wall biosynthesis